MAWPTPESNSATKSALNRVILGQCSTAPISGFIHVNAFVKWGWISVIYPQESANLHFVIGLAQLVAHTRWLLCGQFRRGPGISQFHNPDWKTNKFRRQLQNHLPFAYNDRSAPQFVAAARHPVSVKTSMEQEPFHTVEHIFNSRHKIIPRLSVWLSVR